MSDLSLIHIEESIRKMPEGYISPLKGRKLSAETRKKMSEAAIGRKASAETRKKISEVQKGKKISDESIKKCKETWAKNVADGYESPHKGRKKSEAHREKISKTLKGRKRSDEFKEKISKTLKGRKHTAESRKKMSKAQKGSNSSRWNPNREEVARNAAVYSLMVQYLNLPFRAKVDTHEVICCLGYTKEDFVTVIEGKFYSDMGWKNRGRRKGKWNIHHILPISWFVKFNVTDPKILNALDNLKPLWRMEHTSTHKSLRKCTKEQRQLWVELFVWHVEYSRRKPIGLETRSPISLSNYILRKPLDLRGV